MKPNTIMKVNTTGNLWRITCAVLCALAVLPIKAQTTLDGHSEEECIAAKDSLSIYYKSAIAAQYCMRGGMNNGLPNVHAYQHQTILTDGYAQYAVVPHSYFAYSADHLFPSTYALNTSFVGGPMGRFGSVSSCIRLTINHAYSDYFPEMKAILMLLFDYAAIEAVDAFGTLPYYNHKNNTYAESLVETYDSGEDVYSAIIADIDHIVSVLQRYEKQPQWYKDMVQQMVWRYGKVVLDTYKKKEGFDTWIRFANSLKLRMALRTVKVDSERSQKWAEEAVASGVIEDVNQQVGLWPMCEGFYNPLVEISQSWHDSRLCASFESLLMSLDHPYTKYFFNKNEENLVNAKTGEITPAGTRIVGLRAGGHFGKDQAFANNPYVGASYDQHDVMEMDPLYLIKFAEVDFLRAEGALRGWNMGGTAEFFYTRGIRNASCIDHEIVDYDYNDNVDAYLAKEKATDYTYIDPFGDTPDMPSVTKIGVKWDESEDRETKLEKIITQKYIALYPNSYEAWAELRRTGYPRLFPVLNPSDGDGSLKDGDMVRRLVFFPYMDEWAYKCVEETGLDALGGPDLQATRLWWDVDCDNFSTAISRPSTMSGHPIFYSPDGRRYSTSLRGVNIVRMSNGTVQKVLSNGRR